MLVIKAGADVLGVGIGTGHYLAAYPPQANVIGIDLSQRMLDQAVHRIHKRAWTHIDLQQLGALDLQFDADTFDYVVALHTLTVVEDPLQIVSEMLRVCKPRGEIAMINQFRRRVILKRPIVTVEGVTKIKKIPNL